MRKVKAESAKSHFRKFRQERKRRPVYYALRDTYWKIYNYIERMPLNIMSFFQRGKRGWSSQDTWSFDLYLAKVVSEGLAHLKKHQCGYPCELTEGQWIDILNKIINTFETAKRIGENDTFYISSKEFTTERYEEYCKIADNLNKIKDEEDNYIRVLDLKQSKRYEEGFDLFKKYFFSLWD